MRKGRLVRSVLLPAIVASLSAMPALAQWTSVGPEGGDVGAIAVDAATPTTVYAGMYNDSGVYKSTNGGGIWSMSSNGLPSSGSYSIEAFVINPQAPAGLYIGTSIGVFRSTDAGASWSNVGPSGQYVRSLALNPQTPTTVYAGTFGGGVFKSTNGGLSGGWTPVNTGLTQLNVWALAVDPVATSTVYAGTSGGVFKSVNAGASWTSVGLATSTVFVFAIDPSNTNILPDRGPSRAHGPLRRRLQLPPHQRERPPKHPRLGRRHRP